MVSSSAQTFKLPNGVQETFGEEWIIERSADAKEESVSRARWKSGNGPDVSFQTIGKPEDAALKDEQLWLPIALADEGLKVRTVQEVDAKDLGATRVRRYVCEDGQKRQIIVETGSQPLDTGAFRVMIRYPENMEAKPAEVTAALKSRHFVKSEEKKTSLFNSVISFGGPAPAETESGEFVRTHRSAMVISTLR